MHDAAVTLPIATGDQRRPVGKLVFAHLAVQHQLIQRRFHHRHRRRQPLQVDEPAAGIVGGRQEGRRRPAGPVGAVAPGDAAQIDGVEQERADIDVLPAGLGGDLLGDGTLGAAWGAPKNCRLARLDQEREGGGELARAQRVVGGDGVGVGRGGLRANGCRGRSASGRSDLRRDRAPLSLSPVQGKPAGWMAPVLMMRKRSPDRGVTPQEGGAGKAIGTSAAGPAAGSGEHIVTENWRDCRDLPR